MSYGGKSVYRYRWDMRSVCVCVCACVCVCWFMGVPASHADDDGRLKYMCLQNANPNNKEGLHVFQPSCAACGFNSTTPLP